MEIPEGAAKDIWIKKILAGYDIGNNVAIDAEQLIYIGKLPPREVVLAQLLGMLAAPIRSFLYILDEKSKMGGGSAAQPVAESPVPTAPSVPEVVAEPALVAEPAPSAEPVVVTEPAPAAEAVLATEAAPVLELSIDTDSPEQKVELTQAQ
jgi:hypothetical protein